MEKSQNFAPTDIEPQDTSGTISLDSGYDLLCSRLAKAVFGHGAQTVKE